ncbi:PadR family transcriptional regulator [Paenibacillus sp. RC67]|uniref:PadR family transcriptional regulator n=1 Tax=Paenibacillus sp. RC67 TaxID=3039392 RepID=UPI0024AD26EC|nr:PadR family transcriptional regulator [Paenibacillus sp. RC67]
MQPQVLVTFSLSLYIFMHVEKLGAIDYMYIFTYNSHEKIVLRFQASVNRGTDSRGGAMNTLSYGLLALLSQGPCTGYELMLQIQPVWQAKHSQIYPLLAKMEQNDLVHFVAVPQKEKPDKKVYSITELGIAALQQWIPEQTSEPVKRDELLLKLYGIWLADPVRMGQLFEERLQMFTKKLAKLTASLEELNKEKAEDGDSRSLRSTSFGKHILLKRAMDNAHMEIEWCKWVQQLLREEYGS